MRAPYHRRLAVMALLLVGFQLVASGQQHLTQPAPEGLSVQEGTVPAADGVTLFYRLVDTRGTPVMFLHGGPGLGIDDGGYDIEELAAKGHQLLMFDQRGGGRSQTVSRDLLTIEHHVRDVEALRARFGFPQVALIGLSWGSAVAARYAAAYPDRVSRLILLSPMVPSLTRNRERVSTLTKLVGQEAIDRLREVERKWPSASDAELPTLCHQMFDPMLRVYVVDPAHLSWTRGDICGYSAPALRNIEVAGEAGVASLGPNWDLRITVRQVAAPILVIEGDKSFVPESETREWAAAARDGRMLRVPYAGHMVWLDQPGVLIEALHEFLQGAWPTGSVR